MQLIPIKTPCIGVCSTGIGDNVCRGCKRFSHEVIHWNSYSSEQKRIIDSRLSGFLSQCVQNKLLVSDKRLLQWQLDTQKIRYTPHHDEYCWAYALLKAGANQIEQSEDYGFIVDIHFRELPLKQLQQQIDEEYFTLSEAHFERYMMAPDLLTHLTDSNDTGRMG